MATGDRILILSEAGEGIGYGHYARCTALQQFFVKMGLLVDIFLDVKGQSTFNFSNVNIVSWTTNLSDINKDNAYTHALLDTYLLPVSEIPGLKKRFKYVIALDDFHRIDAGPDLIINPNIFGNKIKYTSHFVGGKDFIILRSSFRNETGKVVIREGIDTILLTVGGSDLRGLIPRLLNILLRSQYQGKINIVAGLDSYAHELEKQFEDAKGRLVFYGFASEELMKQIMLNSDLAISACGQTLHEMAWLGVPTIGICVGDDQLLNMQEYLSLGYLSMEIYWNSADFDLLINKSLDKFMDASMRKQVSSIGMSSVSNQGLNNIYNAIFA